MNIEGTDQLSGPHRLFGEPARNCANCCCQMRFASPKSGNTAHGSDQFYMQDYERRTTGQVTISSPTPQRSQILAAESYTETNAWDNSRQRLTYATSLQSAISRAATLSQPQCICTAMPLTIFDQKSITLVQFARAGKELSPCTRSVLLLVASSPTAVGISVSVTA